MKKGEEKLNQIITSYKLGPFQKACLEKLFFLPEDTPQLVVHPCKTAKGGKFDCSLMSLSVLLDYRQEDQKESSFEVSLFAELFNEMLLRDFGLKIYRILSTMTKINPVVEKSKIEKQNSQMDNIQGKVMIMMTFMCYS